MLDFNFVKKSLIHVISYYNDQINYYLSLVSSNDDPNLLVITYLRLSEIFIHLGENSQGLFYLDQINYLHSIKDQSMVDISGKLILVDLEFQKTNYSKVINILLNIIPLIDNETKSLKSEILFQLILTSILLGDDSNIDYWLNEYSLIPNNNLYKQTDLQTLRAIRRKFQPRLINKAEAMNEFSILLSIDNDLIIRKDLILIHYIDLLFDELRFYEEKSVITDISNCLEKLFLVGTNSYDLDIMLKTFFLQLLLNLISNSNIEEIDENLFFTDILTEFNKLGIDSKIDMFKDEYYSKLLNFKKYISPKSKINEKLNILEAHLFIKELTKLGLFKKRS
ncbi:MAG: hypothetical protein ACFFD1_13965 [Candidatus Thorarchaeota archaeon]